MSAQDAEAVRAAVELEPCPFCGNAASFYEGVRNDDDAAPRPHRLYVVECEGCDFSLSQTSTQWWGSEYDPAPPKNADDARAYAAVRSRWNTRAALSDHAALREEIARLRRLLGPAWVALRELIERIEMVRLQGARLEVMDVAHAKAVLAAMPYLGILPERAALASTPAPVDVAAGEELTRLRGWLARIRVHTTGRANVWSQAALDGHAVPAARVASSQLNTGSEA